MAKYVTQRNLLLAAYPYFDINAQRWKDYWNKERNIDPFVRDGIFPKRSTKTRPRCWQEALETSSTLLGKEICFLDENFPDLLAGSPYAPAVIYIQGAPIPPAQSLISIVGTRNPSSFGYTNALHFSGSIAALGFGIISGLARGIDTLAHEASLEQGAYTLAVLGTGLAQTYPKENSRLREKILCNGGTIVSQFPDQTPPFAYNFPRRNALIATLGSGTIVIEGGEASGAIITGKLAMEHGLSCITLLQDYRSFGGKGAIQLLENSASPARNVTEALQLITQNSPKGLYPLREKGNALFFSKKSLGVDDYARLNKLTPMEAIIQIERLMLEGKLERLPNQSYRWKIQPERKNNA